MDDFTPSNLSGSEEGKAEQVESAEENSSQDEIIVEKAVDAAEAEQREADADNAAEELTDEESVTESTAEEQVEAEVQSNAEILDKLDKMNESQLQLLERIDSLNSLFNARIMYTDHEEKITDQMHKELQKYKEGMYAQLIRPILLDIIDVRDSIMRITAAYLAKPEGEQNIPNKTFADYALDLQDILEKNDVEVYRSAAGGDFVPLRQRVVKKIATDDKALHGKVAESLSSGYSYEGRTISPEKITVYFYDESIQKNENSEVIENG